MKHKVLIETFPHGRAGEFIRQIFDELPSATRENSSWRIRPAGSDIIDVVHSSRVEEAARSWDLVLVVTCDPRRSILAGQEISRQALAAVDPHSDDFHLPPCEYWAFWHHYWLDYGRLSPCHFLPLEGFLSDPVGWFETICRHLRIAKVAPPTVSLELPEDCTVQHPELAHFFGAIMGHELSILGYPTSDSAPPSRCIFNLPPKCAAFIEEAKKAFSTGKEAKMQKALSSAMDSARGNVQAELQVSVVQRASDWAAELFRANGIGSPVYRYSFPRFFEFLDDRLSFSSIQRLLLPEEETSRSPESQLETLSPPPVVVSSESSNGPASQAPSASLLSNDEPDPLTGLFEGGNYAAIALGEPVESWRYFAAKGLIGNMWQALEGLSRFNHPKARFYSGVASWIAGDEPGARQALEAADLPEARRLLELIARPSIDVLLQAPSNGQYVPDFPSFTEGRFRVKNIGVNRGNGLSHTCFPPGCDAGEFLGGDFAPAFYLCREIEWMDLPTNLHKLECPIFGHTEDYDIHLQSVFPRYGFFDRVVTCGSYEWTHLSKMLPVPVCTFPKAYGLLKTIPELGNEKRDTDIFLSGTIFHPYHPDKARLIYGLLGRLGPEINVKVISSHLPRSGYFGLLARTKISLPYVRFDGSMPTRGMEALAMGNALILQKGCSLSAFFGEDDGVFECDYWSDELPTLIEKILKNWQDIVPQVERGARRVREEFSMQAVTQQYLRFLTALSAMPTKREERASVQICGKRSVISVGCTFDSDNYLESLARMAREFHDAPGIGPSDINDFAREVILFYMAGEDEEITKIFLVRNLFPVSAPEFLEKALEIFRSGVELFPRFLALQFNLMRVLYHFGDSQGEARKIAEGIVSSQESDWDLGPLDDVLPYDFFPGHFNYRAYFDLGVKVMGGEKAASSGFFRLIRASAAHYASLAGGSLDCARAAVEFDEDFPLYCLDLAKRLALTSDTRQEAAQILADLAAKDVIPLDAWDEIQNLKLSNELSEEVVRKLSQRTKGLRARIVQ